MGKGRDPLGGTLPNDRPLEDIVAQLKAFKTRLKTVDRKPTFQPTDLTLITLAKQMLVRLEREGRHTRDLLEIESMKACSTGARQREFELHWNHDYEILVQKVKTARLDLVIQSRDRLRGLLGETARQRHRLQEMVTENERMKAEREENRNEDLAVMDKFGEMSLMRLEKAKELGRLVCAIRASHQAIERKENSTQCFLSSILREKVEVRNQTLLLLEAYTSAWKKLKSLHNKSKSKQHVINIINGKLSSGKFKLITFENYLNEKLLSLKLLRQQEIELGKRLETAENKIRNEALIAMMLETKRKEAIENYEHKKRDIPTFPFLESAIRTTQDQWLQLVATKPTLLQKEAVQLRSLKEDKREIMELKEELSILDAKLTNFAVKIGTVNYFATQNQTVLHWVNLVNTVGLDLRKSEMQSVQSELLYRRNKISQLILLDDKDAVRRLYQMAVENKYRDKEEVLREYMKIYGSLIAEDHNISLQLGDFVTHLTELNKTLSECRTTYKEKVKTIRLRLGTLVEAITQWQHKVRSLIKEKFVIFSEILQTKKELKLQTDKFQKLTLMHSKTKTKQINIKEKVEALLFKKHYYQFTITAMHESTIKKANVKVIRQLQIAGDDIMALEQAILMISDEIKSLKNENEAVNGSVQNVEDELAELRQFHRANIALLAKLQEEMLQERQRLADSWDCMLVMAEAELKLQHRTVNRLGDVRQKALIQKNALQPFIQGFQVEVEAMKGFMSELAVMARLRKDFYKETEKLVGSGAPKEKAAKRTSEFSEDLIDISGAVSIQQMLQDGESTLPREILTAKQTSGEEVSSESPSCIELGKILQYLKRTNQTINTTFVKRKLEQTQAQKTFMSPHWGCLLPPRPVSAPLVRVRKIPNSSRTKKHVNEGMPACKEEQILSATTRSVNAIPPSCRKPLHLPPLPNIKAQRKHTGTNAM